jgi:hypothetical protein
MKKKWGFILFVLFCIQSCQYFEKKVPNKEILLQKELEKINWKKVDAMPSIAYCDSIEDKALCEACFFDYFKLNLYKKISNDTILKLYPELDTIKIKVTVFADATLKFTPSFTKPVQSLYDVSKIDSVFQEKLNNFATVEPAIKRGIKVKSEFVIPIILK